MDEQQIQLQIIQLVLKAMSGDPQATKQIELIMQAAQNGDTQALQIVLFILQVALQIALSGQQPSSQLALMARFGAKLNYIRHLNGKCSEGYQMEYFQKGGHICKKCMKKKLEGGPVRERMSVADLFMETAKGGKKMKKKACGGNLLKRNN